MAVNRVLMMTSAAVAVAFVALPSHAALVIGFQPTAGVSCVQGVCAPTATDGTLNVDDARADLQMGNLSVKTTGSGGIEAGDIVIKGHLGWASGSTLSLSASHSVLVEEPMNVGGVGGLSIATNGDDTGGRLAFGPKGRIRFAKAKSILTINGNPYELVGSLAEIENALTISNTRNLALMDNYDASHDGKYLSSPISEYFGGIVEGLGNSISNVRIAGDGDRQNNLGLISTMNGTVSNLRVLNINISIKGRGVDFIGGLVGLTDSAALFIGDEVTGVISSRMSDAGGMVGLNTGSIVDSATHVDVTGHTAGGLVAFQGNEQNVVGIISKSSATGAVYAESGVGGGLVGNIGGGLVGNTATPIDQSFATGSVDGKRSSAMMGGLVGQLAGSATIANSYASGAIGEGQGKLGGLIGDEAGGSATASYAAGRPVHPIRSGGFAGGNEGTTNISDYWDVSTSRLGIGVRTGSTSGVTGLTTGQLKSGLPPGFDPTIWARNKMINNGLPYLINNPPQ